MIPAYFSCFSHFFGFVIMYGFLALVSHSGQKCAIAKAKEGWKYQPSLTLLLYFMSCRRCMKVTICSLVTKPLYCLLPSASPLMRPVSSAHARAS